MGDASPGRELRFDDLLRHDPLPVEPLDGYDDRSLMAILYTSGSTGRPKGVMLPSGSFFSCGQAFAERYGILEDDNFILPVPLAHATGALTAQSIALHAGCRLTVVDRFSPSAFWAQVAETGATVTILFPAQLNLLLEVEHESPPPGPTPLRLVITHAWNERFRQSFGVELATVWGMTETGALCVGSAPGEDGGEGFIGAPMIGVDVKIADDRLNEVTSRDGRRDLPPPPPRDARLSAATSRPPPPPWWTAGCARAISAFAATTAGSTSPAGSRT